MSWIESSSLFTYTGNKLQLNLTPQGNSKARAEFLLHECIHYYFHHKKLCSVFTLKEMQNIVLKIWLFPFGNSVGSLVVYDLCDFWEGPEFVLFFPCDEFLVRPVSGPILVDLGLLGSFWPATFKCWNSVAHYRTLLSSLEPVPPDTSDWTAMDSNEVREIHQVLRRHEETNQANCSSLMVVSTKIFQFEQAYTTSQCKCNEYFPASITENGYNGNKVYQVQKFNGQSMNGLSFHGFQ